MVSNVGKKYKSLPSTPPLDSTGKLFELLDGRVFKSLGFMKGFRRIK